MLESLYRYHYLGSYKEIPAQFALQERKTTTRWITDTIPSITLPEQATNAGILLQAFLRGIQNTYDLSNPKKSTPPVFLALTPTEKIPTGAAANVAQQEVYIRADFIADWATLPTDQPVLISDNDGKEYMFGNSQEYFELGGAEEGNHLLHPSLHNDYPNASSSAEYISRPIEFTAHEWKQVYARHYKLSNITKKTLHYIKQATYPFMAMKRKQGETTS